MGAAPHVDVIVLGATLHGLAAACWLAESGASVRVLERRAALLDVSTARAPGLLHTGLTEHPWRLVNALGADQAGALYRFGAEGLALLEQLTEVSRGGVLWAAVDEREPDELRRSHAAWRSLGISSELLSPDQVDAAAHGAHFGPGLLRPDEGSFDPAAAALQLAARASAAGAHLHLGVRALSLATPNDVIAVHTDAGPYTAELVLLAAEADLCTLDPYFHDKLFPVREQALLLPGGPRLPYALRAGFGYTTALSTAEGLQLAGCRWATPHLETGERDDTHTTPAVQERLKATARRFFPAHAAAPSRRWSWITAHTCDGLPLLGPLPGLPRVVVCAGFSGNDPCLGLRAARAAVDGICTGEAPGVPSLFYAHRFV